MSYLKNIIAEIEDLVGINDIVGASEEIASMKMRTIRTKVLANREINDELTQIYRDVNLSYKSQITQLMEEKKRSKLSGQDTSPLALKTGNGKIACVYLSANSGLFSNILEQTYSDFKEYLKTHQDVVPVIIGEFGKRLFSDEFPGKQFLFYPLADDTEDEGALKKITEDLATYANVIIFYARFESMAQQTVTMLDVSGQDQEGTAATTTFVHYLFEPSLEKIITFFESEIFAGIIQQNVTESELARYASRITTLDMARENIDQQLKTVNLQKRVALHRQMNKKQTEGIMGMSLWKLV